MARPNSRISDSSRFMESISASVPFKSLLSKAKQKSISNRRSKIRSDGENIAPIDPNIQIRDPPISASITLPKKSPSKVKVSPITEDLTASVVSEKVPEGHDPPVKKQLCLVYAKGCMLIMFQNGRDMEMDRGKLFVGGISWDTNEERLKEYFGTYGEVMEAVIMRDRTTGRARGFGFIVFADPTVAERVVKEKHVIDGRTVEAKKAVPRDDQNLTNRNSSSTQGSPVPGRTKKIFVGGLASTVTESDFKNYFSQFGSITDVVVMYDHNTQRPRGFGFITYDSEDAVDRVLHKTFHELNGKMVEVKRAVPKELSPGPSRGSPLLGYNYGFSRGSGFLSGYPQGYNLSSLGGYGVRMDGRYSPLVDARAGVSHFGSPAYGVGMNIDQGLNQGLGGGSSVGYGRVMSPYVGGTQSRYNTPIGYNNTNSSSQGESFFNSPSRNVWGNGGLGSNAVSNVGSGSYIGSGSGGFGVFRNGNWGTSNNNGGTLGGVSLGFNGGTVGYRGGGENNYPIGSGGFGRNSGTGVGSVSAFSSSRGGYEGSYGDIYRGGSVYGDQTWQTPTSGLDNSGSFGYALGNSADVADKESEDFGVGYDIPNRQSNRGIAT
ncbi:RNA-binding (RRM/RBD/RNP motifs) family protein [Striga hermonthica]|uniref:RNA-binding (RRM/RBD/RNP motifs) family protein n=1 Tax=Striga hermonthica TaxID=68872 RepID=A0A9N7RMN4_STRHE|nr:RNA-binding (RRM/RBD/RNP motifs) family protein [Striga hermonthica]